MCLIQAFTRCCAFPVLSLTLPFSSQVEKKGLVRACVRRDVKVGSLKMLGFVLRCARALHCDENLLMNNGWKCRWRGHPVQLTNQLMPTRAQSTHNFSRVPTHMGTMTASLAHLRYRGVHGGCPSPLGGGTAQHRIWDQCHTGKDVLACNPCLCEALSHSHSNRQFKEENSSGTIP